MQEKQSSYREIFERVYTDNYLRLYYYVLHIVNDEEAAKDILNAFLWLCGKTSKLSRRTISMLI